MKKSATPPVRESDENTENTGTVPMFLLVNRDYLPIVSNDMDAFAKR